MSRFSLYKVMTNSNREKLINIKINEDVRHKIHVVAELRGLKMSQVLHSYIIQAIREERDKNPALFDELVQKRKTTSAGEDAPFSAKTKKQSGGSKQPKLKPVDATRTWLNDDEHSRDLDGPKKIPRKGSKKLQDEQKMQQMIEEYERKEREGKQGGG